MSLTFLNKSEDGNEWISVSDMMSGLMVIFLFIAVSYMMAVKKDKDKIESIAKTYKSTHETLYKSLLQEFKNDLPRWSAHIDSNSLAVRFTEPDVLFDKGSANLKPNFKDILSDFFPRYINILRSEQYDGYIAEVRIEGHTSSEWKDLPLEKAYFSNMALSQARTRAVLEYVMGLPYPDDDTQSWLRSMVTANGLSSSKLVVGDNGNEDKARSRRVEFRVRTNAENRIFDILKIGS